MRYILWYLINQNKREMFLIFCQNLWLPQSFIKKALQDLLKNIKELHIEFIWIYMWTYILIYQCNII